jgi:hypothetical protein
MARNVLQGTYAEPVYAKTPENPPHCHVPLNLSFYWNYDKIAEQWLQIVYRTSTNLANENL